MTLTAVTNDPSADTGWRRLAEFSRDHTASLESDRMPRPRAIVLALLALCALLLLWAATAHVNMIVQVEGRIVAAEKNQIIQHLEGGVVLELPVAEGALVKRGDVLARVSDVTASSELAERLVKIQGLSAKIARLTAEANGLGSPQWPKGLDVTSAAAQAEASAFTARHTQLNEQLGVAQNQIDQRSSELTEQQGQHQSLLAAAALAAQQLQILTGLAARDAASKLELLESQSRVQELQSKIAQGEATVPRVLSALAEARGRRETLESQFRADARTGLTTAQTDLDQLYEEVKVQSDRMRRTDLRAPIGGIVNRIYVNTIGGVLKPGDALMEITPVDGRIVVEGRVRPGDRGELGLGLPSKVRLSAYDFTSYGTVAGTVRDISADTVPDERGERYYRVRIALDTASRPFSGQPILPGMTATADVVVGSRSVLAYLISPITRFFRTALSEPR